MKSYSAFCLVCLAALTASAADIDVTKLPPASTQKDVTYAKDIRPLFETSCFRCHGEKQHKGDLRLDSLEAVLKGGEDGKIVTVGDSAKSDLVISISQLDPETAMPPKGRKRGPGGGDHGPGNPPGGGQPGFNNAPAGGGESKPGGPGPGGPGGGKFPPAVPLTAEQVGLVRAWIDQGAK